MLLKDYLKKESPDAYLFIDYDFPNWECNIYMGDAKDCPEEWTEKELEDCWTSHVFKGEECIYASLKLNRADRHKVWNEFGPSCRPWEMGH